MKRGSRAFLVVAAFMLLGLGGAATLPASASAATRIDLRVLLLGTSTTDPNFQSWQSALQREGVPFDTVIATSGHTPVTASTLSTTLSDGTQEGKYQAVIVSAAGLPICTTTCVSGLAQSEWNAIEDYEQTFAVREIDGDAFPSATYGLNAPTVSGTLDGLTGTLTADGTKNFPYLKGAFLLGQYPANTAGTTTYGYEATPISTTNFDTLVTGPNNSALVGIYTDPSGVQHLVETYGQNAALMQAELLEHGALAWVTRGVYFGDQRNYLETHIDDNFLADDTWDTTNHLIDYNPADAIREQASDIVNAATWSAQNNFRLDMLFNGGGSEAFAEGCTLTAGGGGTGSGHLCVPNAPNTDPLLAQLTSTCTANCGPGNAGAGQPYTSSFGWINHTWDHPNVDQGCASQNYIESEIQQNSAWAVDQTAQGSGGGVAGDPNNGGLGLTSTTDPSVALGATNPGVLVTGEHSGVANLTPGNPGTVDPPIVDGATATAGGGTLKPGTYTYAMTDQFTPTGGESLPSNTVSATLTSTGSVTVSFDAACHASDVKIYRTTNPTSGPWTLVATINQPATAPPNPWFADPLSTTDTENGGAEVLSQVDSGGGSTTVSALPTTNGAVESGYQQNTQLAPAFTAAGVKVFGTDSSKAYPNPPTATFTPGSYTGPTFPAGSTWTNAGAQAEPRYPTNIYYNVSTEAQEVDEYNHLYLAPSAGGVCQNTSTTTCESTAATFAQIITGVDQNMFLHVTGNDPRPHYFHQTNIMGKPPAGAPTGAVPNTSPTVGDGLFYTTMNGLLAEYNTYFSVPVQQLTMPAIANLLVEQAGWAANTGVTGYIQGNQVTVTNSGTSASTIPLTGIPTVGSAYGGTTSGWTSAPVGTSTYSSSTTWPTAGLQTTQAPQGSWVGQSGSSGYLLAGWDGAQDVSNLPNITPSLTQGSRTSWAANSTDVRAVQAPDGSSVRNATAYTGPNAVTVKLTFANAYTGTVNLYALDWKSEGDAETLSVDDGSGPRSVAVSGFGNGAWATFPVTVGAAGTVTITATKTAGTQAELSAITVGGAGAPPATGGQQLSQGGWVGSVGSSGYDLAAWNGPSDLTVMPNASVKVVQGSRYQWATNSSDARALSDPSQVTRTAATYYDPNQIQVQLTFTQAYSGNVHLYAVDWDSTARRELITVNGQTASLSSAFNNGAWVAFPVNVPANGTVTITVDNTGGGTTNAVLSGIFLGDAGAPPPAPPTPITTTSPQGNWSGTYGVAGYDLAGWDRGNDVASMPGISTTLAQGTRYNWITGTTDVRALSSADGSSRAAGAYTDPNEVKVQLGFTNAYSGNVELYAVDWDSAGRRENMTVNGVTATIASDFSQGAWVTFPVTVAAGGTVTITVDRTGGPNAVLSGIFIGGAGTPPAGPPTPNSSPQGNWVGTYGAGGYDMAGWNNGTDVFAMPGVTATMSQGSTYVWAPSTTDARALANSAGTARAAAAWYGTTQVSMQLNFSAAYTGNLELYAVDWDSAGRRETITVNGVTAHLSNDFSQGAWVAFPINVAANGSVTITVNDTAGPNAVLSGIFLGGAGTPPAGPPFPNSSPQGNWSGTYGSAGYDLAAWDNGTDVSSMPGVSMTLAQGTRYNWTTGTTDVRALSSADGTSRAAGAYIDPNEVRLQLTFTNAYSGNLELYAVDWDSSGRRENITVGGQTAAITSDFSQGAWLNFPISVAAGGTLTIMVDRTSGPNVVLSGLFLGGAGAPPPGPPTPSSSPQGSWVGTYGSAGYDLAGWASGTDVVSMPGVTTTLAQGATYDWNSNTTDVRALANAAGTARSAATYYDPNEVRVQLNFSSAYTGNLELYAVDWDAAGRRETVTVGGVTAHLSSDFSQGAWLTFPITVAAGGTVTITVDRTAGLNAVLSGIFLGGAGTPPAGPPVPTSSPQGNWTGTYGVAGYDLAAWDNGNDVASMPGISTTLAQGTRYNWITGTTDVRALSSADGSSRAAAAYTDPNEVKVQLGFTNAYSGNVELYAVDWDSAGRRENVTVNGVTATIASDFSQGAWLSFPVTVAAGGTVTITVDRTGGPNAVLSGIFIGGAGTPPAGAPTPTSSPQGNWVGTYGAAGYDMAGWNNGTDVTEMPGVTTTLAQGATYDWAPSTTDVRALANAAGTTRSAAAYYDPNQVSVQLNFSAAYTGNLHLYAVDWDDAGRRETITVNGVTAHLSSDFSQGAWVAFPLNVAANSSVTITVSRTAGPNAVLSGIFLGDAGTPPAGPPTPSSSPQGNWVGTYGSGGYDLAAFNGGADLISMPGVAVSLAQGSQYEWAAGTTDVRALADPSGITRNAATYYDPNQVNVNLTFSSAYTGNLELYAVDWDSTGRRESITVGNQTAYLTSDFSQGAWVTFPISVSAGGTVTVSAQRLAGPNAVLSGLFLN